MGTLAAIVVAFGLVYLHVLSAQRQFELDRLDAHEDNVQLTYQSLRGAVDADNSPARIMAEAGRLHMVEPAQITAVRAIRGGTVVPGVDPAVRTGANAPGGAADWSAMKPDLAASP